MRTGREEVDGKEKGALYCQEEEQRGEWEENLVKLVSRKPSGKS